VASKDSSGVGPTVELSGRSRTHFHYSLAIASLLHVNAIHFSFTVDTLIAGVMCICKLIVTLSVAAVNGRLSPLAQAVAGPWVYVFAITKALMALCSLVIALVNMFAFQRFEQEPAKLCLPGYMFCWSLLLSLVLQCLSGFAIFRIYERAAGYVEDSRVFSRVVGCNWIVLVGSTFGVGLGFGLSGALFVFDSPDDHLDPFYAIGSSYLVAAACQMFSGFALLVGSNRVQDHFAKRGARGVEMRSW